VAYRQEEREISEKRAQGHHVRIEISQLSKSYDGFRVLNHLSFEIDSGHIIAVLGVNGAGKTTLLRCMAGIASPDRGRVCYDGEPFSRERLDLRRRMFFVPDTPFLCWEMTALQHIAMVLHLYEAETDDADEVVLALLEEFDLLPHARAVLTTLSRGQAYKTTLVPFLAIDPEVWLLDEPFASGMDPPGISAFKRHAREAARAGHTVIYSTQLLEVAERFSDRVCLLHDGGMHAFDTMDKLRSRRDGGLAEIFDRLRSEEL
jgi:ABC-type multidrug transport system ATPase subunit